MPKNGSVAEPALSGVTAGSGVIRMPPVSVCHHVSTIGQRPSPTTSWYQRHSGSLIGSPTVPRSCTDDRSYFSTQVFPSFIRARRAVGAV